MDRPQPTDVMLQERIQAGDEEALIILFARYDGLILSVINSKIRAPTDVPDVLQEVHMAIWQAIRSRKPVRSLKAWIGGIARNKCADYWRAAEKRDTPFSDDALVPLAEALNLTEVDLETLRQKLRKAVADLKPIYKLVVELHYFELWPIRRIAEEKNLKTGTVKRRLNVARIQLRKRLRGG